MTRSPALIREIACRAIELELFGRRDLLGSPRRWPWWLLLPAAVLSLTPGE